VDFEPFGWIAGLGLLWLLAIAVAFVVWIWAIVHAIRNPALDDTMRIVWILVIVFTQFIGAIVYFIVAPKGHSTTGTMYRHGP
jgi:Phospholipase_D-nuclease N-terminal